MEEMPKHPHMTRRGNVYYLRRRVPVDLLQHYAPKVQFVASLGTSDGREALRKVRLETAKLEEQFHRVRQYKDAPVRDELPDAEVKRLSALYIHRLLDADDEMRRDGLWFRDGLGTHEGINERDFIEMGQTLAELLPVMRNAVARGDIFPIQAEMEVLLEDEGVKLTPDSDAYRKLGLAILRADVQAKEIQRQRQAGDPIETPPEPPRLRAVPAAAVPKDGDTTVESLWKLYKQERNLAPKTESDFGTSVRRFVDVNGNLPVRSVTKAHARAFKDAMLRMPKRLHGKDRTLTVPQVLERFKDDTETRLLDPRTVNEKALAAVRAVFGYAIANGLRDDNPISGIKAAGEASDGPSRLPYSAQDLRVIFGSEVFTQGARPVGGGGEAAKWLPLLALFTGARLEEIGRLDTADVCEEEGVQYLFIRPGTEGRRVKNKGSRRKVPIHPELARLGFLEYVKDRREAQDETLFPNLKSSRAQRTAAFSSWWGRYTGELGITDSRKVFHSFRHGVKRALRHASVETALTDALMGHAARDVASLYGLDEEGQGFPLSVLRDALARLAYPGLELP
jgi:integrase